MSFVLTEATLKGLFYIQRYRYLTIVQFAYITGSNYNKTARILRIMKNLNLLGYFGNVPFPDSGKTSMVHFLTRKGHAFLIEHLKEYQSEIGNYKKVKSDSKWSPQMFHNLKLIDCFLAVENQIEATEYRLYKVFTETKMERLKGGGTRRETTDFIDDESSPDSRIIPDGAFILERLEDKKRFLFFLELDNGTETIISNVANNFNQSIQYKYNQYIRYLKSRRYTLKYNEHGDFNSFRMLFVTTSKKRSMNVSKSLTFMKKDYRNFFSISNIEDVQEDFFFSNWVSPLGDLSNSKPLFKRS